MTKCKVLAAQDKDFTYLFLREDLALDDVPDELRALFRDARCVMELDLAERSTLAQQNIATVQRNLSELGYHLQLPPTEDPSGWLDLPSK